MTNDPNNIQAALDSLSEFNQDNARKAWAVYVDTIVQITGGAVIRPETIHRAITAAGRTVDDFRADVERAGLIQAVANAQTEASEIDAKTRPLADEWRTAKAEFDRIAKEYREKSERLELQIQSIRIPLKQHDSLRQQLASAGQPMPDSIKSIVVGWERQKEGLQAALKAASRETFEPNDEHGGPAAPERVAAYHASEIKRLAEVRRLEARIAILRRAEAIVREVSLDAVTGLWDPFADVASCLATAQQESDASESARLEAEKAASISQELAQESADDSNEKRSDLHPPYCGNSVF